MYLCTICLGYTLINEYRDWRDPHRIRSIFSHTEEFMYMDYIIRCTYVAYHILTYTYNIIGLRNNQLYTERVY